jgi:undecaprenyl-diphosphatase
MNPFDSIIIHFLNSFARRSEIFDTAMGLMADNPLLEGGIVVIFFWYALVRYGQRDPEARERLLFGLFASIFAVVVGRTLALALPFRERPMHNPHLNFTPPFTMNPNSFIGWSSFPSDHAVVFLCLAMTIWFVSKRVGAMAIAYCVFCIFFPRVYLGIHYPTDIVAGAAIGISIAYLSRITHLRSAVMRPALYLQEHYPTGFSTLIFVCSFEMAEEFSSIRNIALAGYHGVEAMLQAWR